MGMEKEGFLKFVKRKKEEDGEREGERREKRRRRRVFFPLLERAVLAVGHQNRGCVVKHGAND